MPYSTQRVTSDGTLALLDISIQYFSRPEISVYIGDVLTPSGVLWNWVGTTEKRIQFTPAIALGVEVLLRRNTSISEPRHVFVGGAAFTYQSLDENTLQVMRIVQEARENATALSDVFNPLNMHGNKITKVGVATESGDVVEYSQFVAQTAAIVDATTTATAAAGTASAAAASAINSADYANTSKGFAEVSATAAAASALAASQSAELAATTPVAAPTHAAISKAVAVDADEFALVDSEATWGLKKITVGQLKTALGLGSLGQCRLTKSGSNLLLLPFNGRVLSINGNHYVIPVGGVTLTAPSTTLTLYYIYAFMNAGTMTLEASTTVPATDATTGVRIKTGDATRTLVGMARTVTNAWVDSASQRLVRSWFNRPGAAMSRSFTAQRSTTSGVLVELNSEIRCEFLCFADDKITAGINGYAANSTTDYCRAAIAFDGTTRTGEPGIAFGTNGGSISCSVTEMLTEGYHYATVLGANVSGLSTVAFGSSAGYVGLTVGVA